MTRHIAIASLIWGFSIFLSRIVGLVREATIGRILGGGAAADVYWTAFVVPDFLNYLLAGGALSLVFIPLFGAHLAREDTAGAWEAFSTVANALTLLLALALAGTFVAMPHLAPWIAPGFGGAETRELVHLSRIVLPAQIFHLLGGLLSASLMAQGKHALPALAPLIYSGAIVVGGLWGGKTAGADGFAWGVVVGSAIGPFGLPLWGAVRSGMRWRPLLSFRHPDLRAYLRRSLIIMLGFSIVVVDDWFLKREASRLGSTAISTLQYAKTLMKVPMGVFGLATGAAAFPTLTALHHAQRHDDLDATLTRALRHMLIPALAAQVVLTTAGVEISTIIYGDKITAGQHHDIGVALSIMSLGLWAWAAHTLVARGFYAVGDTYVPTLTGSAVALAALPFYRLFASAWGTAGLAICSTGAVTIFVIVLSLLLRRRFSGAKGGYLPFVLHLTPCVGAGIAAGELLRHLAPSLRPPLLRGATIAGASAGVYILVGLGLGIPEMHATVRLVPGSISRARCFIGRFIGR